jgi:uncharacterized membrane protein YgaE (UPF0421/DUF939 family)
VRGILSRVDAVSDRRLPYRVGTYVQVVKAALACALSWWAASALFPGGRPYFAPLAAVLTVQVSIAESLARGGQRILGVVGGITVSLLLAHALGVSGWSVGLLVLVGMAGATALGFGAAAVSQVGISALLILALKATPAYAAARLIDTIVGAVTAIVVNALVVPPDATPSALQEAESLAARLAEELRRLARACRGDEAVARVRERLRRLADDAGRAKARARVARETLQYSPLLAHRRGRLARVEEAIARLDATLVEIRGMARSLERLDQAGEHGLMRTLEPPLDALAEALVRYSRLIAEEDPGATGPELGPWLRRAREEALAAFRRLPPHPGPTAFREAGSVLADMDRLAADLEASAALLGARGPAPSL